MRKTLFWAFTLFFLVSASQAAPNHKPIRATGKAVLTGKVLVTAPPRKPKKASSSSYYGDDNQPTPTPGPQPPEEILVYVEKVPGKWPAPQRPAVLDQQGVKFTRRILPVVRGTVVRFTNQDPIYHNIFSNSQSNRSFDLGKKSKGQSASVTFTELEVPVKLFCEIHASMSSNILVLQNPFFASTTPGGAYRIEGLPPGDYKVVAWHDYWEPVTFKATVKAGETAVHNVTLDKVRE